MQNAQMTRHRNCCAISASNYHLHYFSIASNALFFCSGVQTRKNNVIPRRYLSNCAIHCAWAFQEVLCSTTSLLSPYFTCQCQSFRLSCYLYIIIYTGLNSGTDCLGHIVFGEKCCNVGKMQFSLSFLHWTDIHFAITMYSSRSDPCLGHVKDKNMVPVISPARCSCIKIKQVFKIQ